MTAAEFLLKKVVIFSDLEAAEFQMLLSFMNGLRVEKGQTLFREGDEGGEMFIVLSGKIGITVTLSDGKELTISEIKTGDFFGEMSIIEQLPRSATALALQETELLSLQASDFLKLVESAPEAAVKILRRMLEISAQRLSSTGRFVSEMVQWGENARRRAITDEATGLFNRRYLEDSIDSLFRRAKMENRYFSYAMFDLDRFGSLNQTYGLPFGDRVIVEMSRRFSDAFAQSDILVRYGGDEFTFLFPDAPPEDALARCRKLCDVMRSIEFPEHPELRISCSIGVAVYPLHAQNLDQLKLAADKALYRAKEEGRDRAVTPEPDE